MLVMPSTFAGRMRSVSGTLAAAIAAWNTAHASDKVVWSGTEAWTTE